MWFVQDRYISKLRENEHTYFSTSLGDLKELAIYYVIIAKRIPEKSKEKEW